MKRLFITIMMILMMTGCFQNSDNVYVKKINSISLPQVYDVDEVEDDIIRLISQDGKKEIYINSDKIADEVTEGDRIVIFESKIYRSDNNELKNDIVNLQKELEIINNNKLTLNSNLNEINL